MLKVLITLHGSGVQARPADFIGALLASRDCDISVLHVVPVPAADRPGQAETLVLEGYLQAETCDVVIAPLVEQLHQTFARTSMGDQPWPRLVPRHLIHRDDLRGVVEHCGVAQQRHDSIALLAAFVQHLQQYGIDAARVTRDSAIGDPATIIRETARHLGADLVVVDGYGSEALYPTAGPQGQDLLRMPCPVLIVPAANEAALGAGPLQPAPGRAQAHDPRASCCPGGIARSAIAL